MLAWGLIVDETTTFLPAYRVTAATTSGEMLGFQVHATDDTQATQKVLTQEILQGMTICQVLTVETMASSSLPPRPGGLQPSPLGVGTGRTDACPVGTARRSRGSWAGRSGRAGRARWLRRHSCAGPVSGILLPETGALHRVDLLRRPAMTPRAAPLCDPEPPYGETGEHRHNHRRV
jgi:hypothetical protein